MKRLIWAESLGGERGGTEVTDARRENSPQSISSDEEARRLAASFSLAQSRVTCKIRSYEHHQTNGDVKDTGISSYLPRGPFNLTAHRGVFSGDVLNNPRILNTNF